MMVKRLVNSCLLLLGLACGNSHEKQPARSGSTGFAPVATPSATVEISRDGKTIARYESRLPDAVVDTDILMIEMNSPDAKYSFMGYIGSTRSGQYELNGEQQPGRATIHLYHDGPDMPPSLTPTEGKFSLTGMNGKSCSGSFSGSLKDPKGKAYTIRGTFSNIPVRNIEAGK
ncbi:MAG: hypothetical protein J7578_01610 [Chitinophagaceae bacterium]|nr:hypothetical protein [Chitinophagaceae bacterium]